MVSASGDRGLFQSVEFRVVDASTSRPRLRLARWRMSLNRSEKMAQIEDWALIAQPLRVGFTWTLVSRLGEMLKEIEGLLGKRDQSFTILGIEFQAEGPQL